MRLASILGRMKALLTLTVLLIAVAATSSAHASTTCGTFKARNPYGSTTSTFEYVTVGTTCKQGRRPLRRFFTRGGTAQDRPFKRMRVGRWTCRFVSYFEPGEAAYRCKRPGDIAVALWMPEREP